MSFKMPPDLIAWLQTKSQDSSGYEHDESNGQFTGSGSTAAKKETASGDKKKTHNVKLPKKRNKISISAAGTALHDMGYKLGAGSTTHHEGAWLTRYKVTDPSGHESLMTVDQVRDLVYDGSEEANKGKKK